MIHDAIPLLLDGHSIDDVVSSLLEVKWEKKGKLLKGASRFATSTAAKLPKIKVKPTKVLRKAAMYAAAVR